MPLARPAAPSVWIRRNSPSSSTLVGKAAETFRRFSVSWFGGALSPGDFPGRKERRTQGRRGIAFRDRLFSPESDRLLRTRPAINERGECHDLGTSPAEE